MMQETPMDAEALRAEIARTRSDLGDTVAALVAKTDLKARTKEAVTSAADQAKDKVRTVRKRAMVRKPLPLAAIAAGAVVIAVAIYLLRGRRT